MSIKEKRLSRVRLLIGIALVIFIIKALILVAYVPSSSMENTLKPGDLVLCLKTHKVKRYDVAVFVPPDDPSKLYIKRVIGLPGDTITIKDHHVYVNGSLAREDFLPEKQKDFKAPHIYKVPKGHYFMMGDNRNSSFDSRYWQHKFVPEGQITAKAVCVFLPFNHIKTL